MKSLLTSLRSKIRNVVREEFELQLTQLRNQVNTVDVSLAQLKAQVAEIPLTTAGNVARAFKTELSSYRSVVKIPEEKPLPFEQSLVLLEKLNDRLFPIWQDLFIAGSRSYVEHRLGSCSHRDHHYAKLFGAYVSLFAKGSVLDIGCGPHGIPAYLASLDIHNLYGLEPLPIDTQNRFQVRRGFNEFIPWADCQFDTVVSGTSLDHVLSLEKSLQEVRRVLRPAGRYLVWIASIPGAAEFKENASDWKAVDSYHLFHFDRVWVEPCFEKYFNIADVTIVTQPGFDHVFYCLTPLSQ